MENNDPIQALVQQIDEILEANGNVTQKTKDVLMFSVVKALLLITKEQKACTEAIAAQQEAQRKANEEQQRAQDLRIDTLEKRNIVTWCVRHPWPTIFILTVLGMLVFSHYGSVVLAFVGVKLPVP